MNTLKTTLLMGILFGLFMALGQLLGGRYGLVIGFTVALAINVFSYLYSDKLALAMNGAYEISEPHAPVLFGIVRRLCRNAGLPMPRLYMTPNMQPNAFATGRDPRHAAVAVTQGIMRLLSLGELEGVLAHELSHVKHRDILLSSIAATLGGAISMVAQTFRFQAFFGGVGRNARNQANPLGILVGVIVAPVAALLIQFAISRSREYKADRGGGRMSGSPLELASALRKIEYVAERMPMDVNPSSAHLYIINPLGGDDLRGLAVLFRTHPLTSERVDRLREQARSMRIPGQFRDVA